MDDPFLEIEPGNSWNYEFLIHPSQSPGLYWYHPHVHGSNTLQQKTLFGAILIENSTPVELETLPKFLMLLNSLDFSASGDLMFNNPQVAHDALKSNIDLGMERNESYGNYFAQVNAEVNQEFEIMNGQYTR